MTYMTAPPSCWKESTAARLYHIPGENTRIIYSPIKPDLPLYGAGRAFFFPPCAGSSPGHAAARPPGPRAADQHRQQLRPADQSGAV